MGFFSSLFGGSNPTLSKDISQFGQIGGFATGLGEKNLTQASNFWSSILSGDPSKTAKTLAPQISSIQQQGEQQKQSTAQFGTRSGGSTAAMQQVGAQTRGSINNLIGSLTGSAASNLGSTGSGLLGQGMSAYSQQAGLSQEQMQNWSNSILGGALTGGAGIGLGKLSSLAGL
jgi:hypothetical protein